MPCGQKKRSSEMIQSQTVTPPFAAIDGTTFKLKTATTNSSTRSQRPRTRFRCGRLESCSGTGFKVSRFQSRKVSSFRFQVSDLECGKWVNSQRFFKTLQL